MTGFFDGGAKSMSFGKVRSPEANAVMGKWRGGPIINVGAPKQQTDWESRELKTWPGGDPILQLPITLDTARGRFPEQVIDGEDDLVRDWYITKGRQDFQALKAALRKAGVSDVEVGGELYGRYVSGVGEKGDPRVFEFVYQPPAQGSGGFMADDSAPAYDPASGQPLNPRANAVNNAVQASMPPQPAPHGQPRFDPLTGQPLAPPAPAAEQPRFDPNTGQPIAPAAAAPEPPRFDPQSGAPLNDAARAVLAQHSAPAQQPAAQPQGGVTNPFAAR